MIPLEKIIDQLPISFLVARRGNAIQLPLAVAGSPHTMVRRRAAFSTMVLGTIDS
jgi:hypothetical protein